jgi:hypothetical protein
MCRVGLSVRLVCVETGNLMMDAQTAFARERRRRRWGDLQRWLGRRPRHASRLQSLEQRLGRRPPATGRRVGLKAVPVASIVGTAEDAKMRAFDRCFRPAATSRHRWERLWMAGRRGAALPPISVFRLGEDHFVIDGHHRLSVAQSLGMAAIDAEVTELRG